MKNNFKTLSEKPFLRNVFMLSSGTIFAQLINMIFSPVLTRVFGPEAYGIMGTFQAIINIIGPIAALTYPISIVLPKDEVESKSLVKISVSVSLVNSILATVILLLFYEGLTNVFNLGNVSPYLFLIPIVIIFSGILQTLEQWFIRKEKYNILAKSKVVESSVTNIGKLSIGMFYPFPSVLVELTSLKSGIKAIFLLIHEEKIINKIKYLWNLKTPNFRELIKKYHEFPLFRAPHQFLNGSANSIPLLLLTSLFGAASAGFFSIAKTVLGVLATVVNTSVGDVFYPRISKAANNKEKVTPLLTRATFYLCLLGIIPYGLIAIFGPQIFSVVFGSEWSIAGEYARWMSLWAYTDFIRMPSIKTLPVLSIQKNLLIYTILLLVSQTIAFLIGYQFFNSDIIGIGLFSITGALLNLILIFATILSSKKFDVSKLI